MHVPEHVYDMLACWKESAAICIYFLTPIGGRIFVHNTMRELGWQASEQNWVTSNRVLSYRDRNARSAIIETLSLRDNRELNISYFRFGYGYCLPANVHFWKPFCHFARRFRESLESRIPKSDDYSSVTHPYCLSLRGVKSISRNTIEIRGLLFIRRYRSIMRVNNRLTKIIGKKMS